MSNCNCCLVDCKNTGKNTKDRVPKVRFYTFPKLQPWGPERRAAWIRFANRASKPDGTPWEPGNCSYICSDHFITGEKHNHPHHPDYNPSVEPKDVHNEAKAAKRARDVQRFKRKQARLYANANPNKQPQIEVVHMPASLLPLPSKVEQGINTDLDLVENSKQFGPLKIFLTSKPSPTEASTYVVHEELVRKQTCDRASGQLNRIPGFYGYASLEGKPENLFSLTGVPASIFQLLIPLTKGFLSNKNYRIEDCLIIFFLKLNLDLSFTAISALFNVHRTTVKRTFMSLLELLYKGSKDPQYQPWPVASQDGWKLKKLFEKIEKEYNRNQAELVQNPVNVEDDERENGDQN